MSKTLNKVTLIGRLGKDPEMKYSASGVGVTKFSLATNRYVKPTPGGERTEETDWHSIVTFEKLAETVNQYLHKGSLVYIEGRIQTRKYDKDGETRYITEIVAGEMIMLDPKDAGASTGPATRPAAGVRAGSGGSASKYAAIDEPDDEIPF